MSERHSSLPLRHFLHNSVNWPAQTLPVFDNVLVTEIATLTRRLVPIVTPLNIYPGTDEKTLDFSTGVTYPIKAERARRNPKVGILFSDLTGYNLEKPPVVLVQGHARVCDTDIQGNTDRYIQVLGESFFGNASREDIQHMMFYLARIWIKVTPLRIFWWPRGNTAEAPQIWQASDGLQLLPSDPAPQGKYVSSPRPETDWHALADHCIQRLGLPVVATVDTDGYPLLMRATEVTVSAEGFHLRVPAGTPSELHGSASLTFHRRKQRHTRPEDQTFVGRAIPGKEGTLEFIVEYPVGNGSSEERSSIAASEKVFGPRLSTEMARHAQPIPRATLPEDRV
jgi:hypothetical protein